MISSFDWFFNLASDCVDGVNGDQQRGLEAMVDRLMAGGVPDPYVPPPDVPDIEPPPRPQIDPVDTVDAPVREPTDHDPKRAINPMEE